MSFVTFWMLFWNFYFLGKTYTMFGEENFGDSKKCSDLGIIPRSVDYLFDLLTNSKDIVNFRVTVSIIEVYKEVYRDLLDTSHLKSNKNKKNKRKSKEDKNPKRLEVFTSGKETMIKNLIESQCNTVDEVLKCIIHAQKNRQVRIHEFIGHHSSRSHCVVTINVLQRVWFCLFIHFCVLLLFVFVCLCVRVCMCFFLRFEFFFFMCVN